MTTTYEPMPDTKQARYQRREAEKMRSLGLTKRARWAHPEDWPEIDRLIYELNIRRVAEKTGAASKK